MLKLDFYILLTIIFAVLKLTNIINWSWWWIVSPLWLPPAIIIAICTLGALAVIVKILFSKLFNK